MSILSIKHIFGIECSLNNSIFYLNEHCYLYQSSRYIILYNIDYKSQRFIDYGNQFDKLELLSVSPNKEYLAIVLNKCRIIIYHINQIIKRKKLLLLKERINSIDILSISFSTNSKYLLTLYGEPDYVLVCWSIDEMKSIGMIYLNIDLSHNPLNLQVSFNPIDSSQILITGNHIFQRYYFNNGLFSSYDQQYQSINIICHCWINKNDILLGDNKGFIYTINQNGDIIQIYNVNEKDESIIYFLPFSRGVFVSTEKGSIIIYERNQNSSQLNYLRKLILPYLNKSNQIIKSLALNTNEQTLLIATNYNHLYQFSFSNLDQTNIFEYAIHSGHSGSIITGVLCITKPILLTIGIDRCLKIWNLQTNNQELNHEFIDEPLSISIHPNGIFICILFRNMIEIYLYTIHGLHLFKQLQICNVQIIEYSNQGHLLLISYDNIIQFHHHYDYNKIIYGRNKDKKFRLIRWSHDDTFILSVDFDNLIIRWDPYTGQQLSQYQIEDFYVEDLLISSDNKLVYILTNNKKLKEFLLMTNIRDINISFDDFIPTTLLINDQTKYLFIGSDKGSIYSTNINKCNHLSEINVHQGPINKLLISFNNDFIISLGDDGNIIIFNYQLNKESKINFRDEILSKEILLKEQNQKLNNLIKYQFEISNEYENNIEIKEEEYIQHLELFHLYCQSNIDFIKNKLEELQQIKYNSINEHQQKLNKLIENKQNSIEQFLEQKNESCKEIIVRDQLLKSDIEHFKINQKQKEDFIKDFYEKNLQLICLSYKDKFNKIKVNSDINENIEYLEYIKDILDEDYQIELTNLNENYQIKLRIILNKIQQLENEEVLLKIRIKQIEEESNDYENQIKQFQIEQNQLINHIQQINNHFDLSKQIIQQTNFIIQQKLKRTNQMENRRDQLEKFAYVFNYKIRELTNQIGPRQHQINALIEQFNNMDNEYYLLNKNNEIYSIKIDHYKSRLITIQKEFQNQIFAIRKLNQIKININEDFKLCFHLINQPNKLIKIIKNIYQKYFNYIYTNNNFSQINLIDSDRQRSFFERNNKRLQKNISIDFKKDKIQKIQTIKEQINLMRQISSYSLKVIQLEQILSDLDIVSNIANQINATTSNQIIDALKTQQTSIFIKQKQSEFNLILNKQQKRIQQLKDFIQILEEQLKEI